MKVSKSHKIIMGFSLVLALLLFVVIVLADVPTHDTPSINSTTIANTTNETLTVYNYSTTDGDGEPVKNIYNFYVNETSLTYLNAPFDGGSSDDSFRDYSGYNHTVDAVNNFTLSANADWIQGAGYDGFGAFKFDASNPDYISFHRYAFSDLTDSKAFTITLWVNMTGSTENQTIISQNRTSAGDSVARRWLMVNYNDPGVGCYGRPASMLGGTLLCAADSTMLSENWYHFALSYNLTTLKIYFNGALAVNATKSIYEKAGGNFFFGVNASLAAATGFTGMLDEIMIFDRALSDEQIEAIYENRTNEMLYQETSLDDVWNATVTPNDGNPQGTGNGDGVTKWTNNLQSENTPPITYDVVLNATSLYNTTNDNLTIHPNTTDVDSQSLKYIYNWYMNDTPLNLLNMPFEAGSNSTWTRDYSLENNGTVVNATWNSSGGYDNKGAYWFNDSAYINLSEPTELSMETDDFTVEARIKINNTATATDYYAIIADQGNSGEAGYYMTTVISTGRLRMYISDGSNTYTSTMDSGDLCDNAWHHVVAVVDRDAGIWLYVDGSNQSISEVGTISDVASITNSNDTLIGYAPSLDDITYDSYMENGTIDEVRIWNRSLTTEQVELLYDNYTNITVSNETNIGEIWNATVTPNDGIDDGTTKWTNDLTIRGAPTHTTPILNATSVSNLTSDNLTVWNQSTDDPDGDPVKNIYNFYVNDSSITSVNYQFEGGSTSGTPSANGTTKDYSEPAYDGIVVNATWNATGGHDGYGGYDFDDDRDFILANSSSSANFSNHTNFTICAWVKPIGTGFDFIVHKLDSGPNQGYHMALTASTHLLTSRVEMGSASDKVVVSSNVSLQEYVWSHVCMAFNNTLNGTQLYVNGTPATDVSTYDSEGTLGAYDNDLKLAIGVNAENLFGNAYNGSIGDVMAFDRLLSDEQIYQLYVNNTHVIVSDETALGEVWNATVTPTDGKEDGNTLWTNNLEVRPLNFVPTHDDPILNATTPANRSSDNLTVWNQSTTDADGHAVKNIYNWYVNDSSLLVFNMPFEGGSENGTAGGVEDGARDYSPYENNGTVYNITWTHDAGYDGKGAYEFNETKGHYINVSNHSSLNFNLSTGNGFSVELRFTSDDDGGTQYLFAKGNPIGQNSTYAIIRDPTSMNLSYRVYNGTTTVQMTGATTINDSLWHHMVMVVDKENDILRTYIDGQLDKSQSLNGMGGVIGLSGDLLIGRIPGSSQFVWNGTIDEFRIWNRSLTIDQIDALYNNNTNFIVSNETNRGEVWNATVTPNDETEDGLTKWSNNLEVNNSVPTQDTPILNATSLNNKSSDNLTVWNQSTTDPEGDSIKNIYNWYMNDSSITQLNMPFEGGSEDGEVAPVGNQDGTYDYSGGENNGTVYNATWNSTRGYDGKGAYIFDGLDARICPETDNVMDMTSQAFTYAAWINTTGSQGVIIERGGAIRGTQLVVNNGVAEFTYRWASGGDVEYIRGTSVVNDSEWHYIAATIDSSGNMVLYVDGSSENQSTATLMSADAGDGLSIGSYIDLGGATGSASLSAHFNGTIDEVTVWNRSLSAEQVLQLYENKTYVIVSNETNKNEVWNATVTPNDGFDDGITSWSNNLELENSVPEHSNPVLNATTPYNLTSDNLTLWNQSVSDADGDATKDIYNWYMNDTSLMIVNMPFEGGSQSGSASGVEDGAKDYSPNSFNGTVYNDATYNSTGGYDGKGAYEFDGYDDYINLSNSSLFTFNLSSGESFSIEARFISLDDTNLQALVYKGNAPSSYYSIVKWNTGKLNYLLGNGTDANSFSGNVQVNDSEWHHVVMVVDTSTDQITGYVDGQVDDSTSLTVEGEVGTSMYLFIGARPSSGASQDWNGTIDEVRIWNRSLTADQVEALYSNHTSIIVRNETNVADVWNATVTPNDGTADGSTLWSNNVEIEYCIDAWNGSVDEDAALHTIAQDVIACTGTYVINAAYNSTGIFIGENDVDFECSGSVFIGNTSGSLFSMNAEDDFNLTNCTLRNFTTAIGSSDDSGAIPQAGSDLIIDNCTFYNNTNSYYMNFGTNLLFTNINANHSNRFSISFADGVNITQNEFYAQLYISNSDNISIMENTLNQLNMESSNNNCTIMNNNISSTTTLGIENSTFSSNLINDSSVRLTSDSFNATFEDNLFEGDSIARMGGDSHTVNNITFISRPSFDPAVAPFMYGKSYASNFTNTIISNSVINATNANYGIEFIKNETMANITITNLTIYGYNLYAVYITNSTDSVNITGLNSTTGQGGMYLSGIEQLDVSDIDLSTLASTKLFLNHTINGTLTNLTIDEDFYINDSNVTFIELLVDSVNASISYESVIVGPGEQFNGSSMIHFDYNLTGLSINKGSGFNTSANITLKNLNFPFTGMPAIYIDEQFCPTTMCVPLTYVGSDFKFNVTGFSNYTAGGNSNLTIFDSNDTKGGGYPAQIGMQLNFTANYTNITSGEAITNETANCTIEFDTSPEGPSNMTYNTTLETWRYNRSFTSPGTINWNVTCNSTLFQDQFASDTIDMECVDNDGDGFNQSNSGCGVVDCDDTNASKLPPRAGLNIVNDTMLCNGTYYINRSGAIITILQHNLTVHCNQTRIVGNTTGDVFIFGAVFNNVTIKGCTLHNYSIGISVTGAAVNLSIYNNTINHSSNMSIRLQNVGTGALIANNTINFSADDSIFIGDSNDVTISGNKINNASVRAIRLQTDNSNCSIFDNTIQNAGATAGIHLNAAGSTNEIYNNTLVNMTILGIRVINSGEGNIIANNTINTSFINSISISGANETNITDNTLLDGRIILETSERTLIKNNSITNDGIRVQSDNNNTIIENTIGGSTGDRSITVLSDWNIIANNTVIDGTSYSIFLSAAHNNTVHNNTVTGFFRILNSYDNNLTDNNITTIGGSQGVLFSTAHYNFFESNIVNVSTGYTVSLTSSDYNIIKDNDLYGGALYIYDQTASPDDNLLLNNTINTSSPSSNKIQIATRGSYFRTFIFYENENGTLNWTINTSTAGVEQAELGIGINPVINNNFLDFTPSPSNSLLNSTNATITLFNVLGLNPFPIVIRNGVECPEDICTPVVDLGGDDYTFNVSEFSNYTLDNGTNTNLSIWDDNDPEGGSLGKEVGDQVKFYANYTNRSDQVPINDSMGAICNITFNISPEGPVSMTFNETSKLWQYNRSFSESGIHDWNVSCYNNTDYDPLNATNNITLSCADDDGDGISPYGGSCGAVDCNDNNASILPPYDGMTIQNNTLLCSGTYYVNATTSSIIISDHNLSLTCNQTIMIGNTSGDALLSNNKDNLSITGCTFDNYSNGIYFYNTNNSNITNNYIYNSSDVAITLDTLCVNNKVSNNSIGNTTLQAILLSSIGSGNEIYDNNITETGDNAVRIETSEADNSIFNNTVSTSAQKAIVVTGTNETNVTDNVVDSQITVESSSERTLLKNNTLTSTAMIINSGCHNNTITENTVDGTGTKRRIDIDSDWNNVTNNYVDNGDNAAMRITSANNNTIQNNTYASYIRLNESDENTITQNSLSSDDIGILLIDSNSNTVSENNLTNSSIDLEQSAAVAPEENWIINNTINTTEPTKDKLTFDYDGDSSTNYVVYQESDGSINWTLTLSADAKENSTLELGINPIINNNFLEFTPSQGDSLLNSSNATITFYNVLNLNPFPVVYRNGVLCNSSICSAVADLGGDDYQFNVSSFSNYSLANGTNTNLSIWDDNDPEGGSQGLGAGVQIGFYANYTNRSDQFPINDSMGGICNITFNVSPEGPITMTFNATTKLWEYNRSFSASGTYDWNVSCYNATGYDPLNATDDITTGCTDDDGDGVNLSATGCGVADCNDNNASIVPPYDGMSITNDTLLCAGTYYLNATTNLITIADHNLSLTCNQTIMKGNTSGNAVYVLDKENLTIKDCTLVDYSISIHLYNASNSNITNNSVYNSSNWGIYAEDNTSNCTFYDNRIQNTSGLSLYQAGPDNAVLNNNIIDSTGDSLAISDTGTGTIVQDNIMNTTTAEDAIDIYNTNDTIIRYNNITNITSKGVYLRLSKNVSIYNNTLTDISGQGIGLENADTENKIYDNTINTSDLEGISITGSSSDNQIYDNTINTTSANSLKIEATNSTNTTNNILISGAIYLLNSSKNIVQLNNINNGSIILENSSTDASTANNLINNTINTSSLTDPKLKFVNLISATNNVIYQEADGKINWTITLTEEKTENSTLELDINPLIQNNLISFTPSHEDSLLNRTAVLTLYSLSLPFTGMPAVYRNGEFCPTTICNQMSYDGSTFVFNVTQFSNFTAGSNSNLSIYDSNDTLGGGVAPETNMQINFTANYTNITSGQEITNDTANCTIEFDTSPEGPFNMTYNSTTGAWRYNRSFSSLGTVNWNVTCNSTLFADLFASDTVDIVDIDSLTVTPINCSPSPTNVSDNVTCYVNVTDDVNVSDVWANVTSPDASNSSQTVSCSGTATLQQCNFTFTNTTILGQYNVTWYANDTSSNSATGTDNFTISDFDALTVTPINCTPDPANVSDNVTCYVNVTDDVNVSDVWANVTSPDASNSSQTVSCSGTATLQQCNFTFTDTTQIGLFNVTWYANDTSSNSATNNTNFTVQDVDSLTITPINCSPDPANYSANVTCYVNVTDDINVSDVWANVTSPDASNSSQTVSCSGTDTLQQCNFTFTNTTILGVYNVTWYANDTSSNNATNTDNFTISDLDSLTITPISCSPDPANYSSNVTCYVNVTDDVNVSDVWANVTSPDSSNSSQTVSCSGTDTLQQCNFTFTNTTILGLYNVTWYANDTSSNNATNTDDFTISDLDSLTITPINCTPDPANYSSNVTCYVNVTDDVNVSDVWANVTSPDASNSSQTVSCSGTDTLQQCNFTFTNTTILGVYNVTWYANDTSSNNATNTDDFTISDLDSLTITPINCSPSPTNVSDNVTCYVNVTDDINVSDVWANVTSPDSSNSSQTVSCSGTDTLQQCNFTFTNTTLLGLYNVTWYANDTSSNNATNTDDFTISDLDSLTITPINCTPDPANYSSNVTCYVNVTDDVNVSDVWANVTSPDASNSSQTVSCSGTDTLQQCNFTFTNTTILGLYNVTWYANDTSSNNATNNDSFTISDLDSLTITPINCSPNPANYSANVTCYTNVTDDVNVSDVWANVTSPDASNSSQTVSCSGSATLQECNFTFTNTTILGLYNVTWYANDTSSNNATNNDSFTISDLSVPIVTLISPNDNNITNVNNITFICNATDDINITNITLYHNISQAFGPNITIDTSGTVAQLNITINNSADGNYSWNCLANDSSSNSEFASANYTLVIDTVPPAVSNITPVSFDEDTTQNFIANVSDNVGFGTCYLYINGTLDGQMDINETAGTANRSSSIAEPGNTTVYANCTDLAGNNAYNITNVTVNDVVEDEGSHGGDDDEADDDEADDEEADDEADDDEADDDTEGDDTGDTEGDDDDDEAVEALTYEMIITKLVIDDIIIAENEESIENVFLMDNQEVTLEVYVKNVGTGSLTGITLAMLGLPEEIDVVSITPEYSEELAPGETGYFVALLQTGTLEKAFDLKVDVITEQISREYAQKAFLEKPPEEEPETTMEKITKQARSIVIWSYKWLLLLLLLPLLLFLRITTYGDEPAIRTLVDTRGIKKYRKVHVSDAAYFKYHEIHNLEPIKPVDAQIKDAKQLSQTYKISYDLATLLVMAKKQLIPRIITSTELPPDLKKKFKRVLFIDPEKEAAFKKLRRYVASEVNKGFSLAQIKDMLLKAGWTKKYVNEVIMPEDILHEYISTMRESGYPNAQIRQTLLKAGWESKTVYQALDPKQDFIDYIKKERKKGYDNDSIRKQLLNAGYRKDVVEELLRRT